MSHKRKRKNSHNNELPAAKRLKSDHNNSSSDDNKNKKSKNKSSFPFEKAKPCDKIVPLNKGKKKKLKIKLREQSIRLQQKSKEIESLQLRINNSYKTYGYYHQLLITFSNTFDQIFVALQQKINSNDCIPLSQKTMEMLVKGIRIKSDKKRKKHENDSDIEQDIDINMNHNHNHNNKLPSYPLTDALKNINVMLENRSKSVMEFVQYIALQINEGNEMNLKSYIDNIRNGMDSYWKICKNVATKYEYQSLLHKQQILLQENWNLSVHYKSLLRHYKYVTDHPKYVQFKKIEKETEDNQNENQKNNSNSNNNNTKTDEIESDGIMVKTEMKNGMSCKKEKEENQKENKENKNMENIEMDNQDMKIMKTEIEHLKDKLNEKTREIYTLKDKLSDNDKSISFLKAKNENFLRQINEQNTMDQCDDLEKTFVKNMNEFSFILQEEYRNLLQQQSKQKEQDLKEQIKQLNKSLSDTKNKLFQCQVKAIKSSSSSHSKTKSNSKHKSSSSSSSSRKRNKSSSDSKDRSKRSKDKSDKSSDKKSKDNHKSADHSHTKSRSRSRSRDRNASSSKSNQSSSSSRSRSRSPSSSQNRSSRNKRKDKRESNKRDREKNKSKKKEKYQHENDNCNENINEKNAICMDSIKEYVFKQLREEIKRNDELQKKMDVVKDKQRAKENEQIEALKGSNQNSNSNNKLNMKLQILKQEVNKSQEQIKQCNDAKNKDKLMWNDEIIKLKEQNDFLVSSNHKNRAELKRMNEERKLLNVKFELHKKQEVEYKKQIAEKENENNIIKKKEFEKQNQFKSSQQTNNILKEMTKKLYQQLEGLKCDLKSTGDDYSEKIKKYQELNKKYELMLDEKRQLNNKIVKLQNKSKQMREMKQMKQMNNSNVASDANSDIQTLQYLLREKKQKLTCAVCTEREKQVLLSKCYHMFCKICIQQQQTARNRSCPLCKKKFDPNTDVKPVAF